MWTAHWRLGGQAAGQSSTVGVERVVGDDAVQQAQRSARGGVEAVAEEDQLLRARRAELAGEPRRGAPRERDAEVDLGDVEERARGGDAEVAAEREHERRRR